MFKLKNQRKCIACDLDFGIYPTNYRRGLAKRTGLPFGKHHARANCSRYGFLSAYLAGVYSLHKYSTTYTLVGEYPGSRPVAAVAPGAGPHRRNPLAWVQLQRYVLFCASLLRQGEAEDRDSHQQLKAHPHRESYHLTYPHASLLTDNRQVCATMPSELSTKYLAEPTYGFLELCITAPQFSGLVNVMHI